MNKVVLTKFPSLLMSFTLVLCSFPADAFANPVMPDFVQRLTPPTQLGDIDTYYQGSTEKPVILIQDLHANYGVQQKIVDILKHLQSRIATGGKPMVVGIEAAWGDVDTSYLSKESKEVRLAAGEFLMKEAEISGMENFAANSEQPVHLVGIDNEQDYLLHRELIRKSLATRLALAQKIQQLRDSLAGGKTMAPEGIQKLWKTEAAFEKGEIGFPELAQELNVSTIANFGEAERLLFKKKAELAQKEPEEAGFFLNNLVKVDQDLALLSRLFRQQLTLEEVQFASKQIPEMLSAIQALIPGENMQEWQEAIRSAIDYYALALMRDKPLGENTRALAVQNPDESIVAVTGGFHTSGIASMLREKNISYVVITPVVESHTSKDEILYFERMLGNDVSEDEITAGSKAFRANRSSAGILGLGMRIYQLAEPAARIMAARIIEQFRGITQVPQTFYSRSADRVRHWTTSLGLEGSQPKLQAVAFEDSERMTWPLHTNKFGNPGAALNMRDYMDVINKSSFVHRAEGSRVPRVLDLLAQGRVFYNVQSSDIDLLRKTIGNYNSLKNMNLKLSPKYFSEDHLYILRRFSDSNGLKNMLVAEQAAQSFDFRAADILITESDIAIRDSGTSMIPLLAHEKTLFLNAFRGAMTAYEFTPADLLEKVGGRIRIEVRSHDFLAETDFYAQTLILDTSIFAREDNAILGVMIRELGHLVSPAPDRQKLAEALARWMQISTVMGVRDALNSLGVPQEYFDKLAADFSFTYDGSLRPHVRNRLAVLLARYLLMVRGDVWMLGEQERLTMPFPTYEYGNPKAAINLTEFLQNHPLTRDQALFSALHQLELGRLFYDLKNADLDGIANILSYYNAFNNYTRKTKLTLDRKVGLDSDDRILGRTTDEALARNMLAARSAQGLFRMSKIDLRSGEFAFLPMPGAPELLDREKELIRTGLTNALVGHEFSFFKEFSRDRLVEATHGFLNVEVRDRHDFLAEYDPETKTLILDQRLLVSNEAIRSFTFYREVANMVIENSDQNSDQTRLAMALYLWVLKTSAIAAIAALETLGATDQVIKMVKYAFKYHTELKKKANKKKNPVDMKLYHQLYKVAEIIIKERDKKSPAKMPNGEERITMPFKADDLRPTPELETLAEKSITDNKAENQFGDTVETNRASNYLVAAANAIRGIIPTARRHAIENEMTAARAVLALRSAA